MKNNFWLQINGIFVGLLVGMMFFCSNVNNENEQLKQRNEGLHKQLIQTQKQLKKAREQNVEQTQKIAELTGNGG